MWNIQSKSLEAFPPRPVVSRATVLLLALILLGMGLGSKIPEDHAPLCLTFGCFGVAAYYALELATIRHFKRTYETQRESVERTLSKRLDCMLHNGRGGELLQEFMGVGGTRPAFAVAESEESG